MYVGVRFGPKVARLHLFLNVEFTGTIWIAPSSLRGVNGYGIFTTRDLGPGESLLGVPDGVSIPVEAYRSKGRPNEASFRAFKQLFDNYWWGRGVPDHVLYDAPSDIVDFQIGFGCLPNHHCILSYLDTQYPDPPYIDSLADRFSQPSAGAFAYNRGREFVVERAVSQGQEIFLNYGHCDRDEHAPTWTNHIPVSQDFEEAAHILQSYQASQRRAGQQNDTDFRTMALMVKAHHRSINPFAVELLPKTQYHLDKILAVFGRYTDEHEVHEELVRQLAFQSLDQRTPEWIRTHGICMDNLVARPSTISLAGQGGFAQRSIRQGQIVAPAPLLQILDREALALYSKDGTRNGTQLLLNYCFGHNESTLLLCPNTNAVLINHCSIRTQECGPLGPNAEYRWSSGWDASSDAWRQMTISELAEQPVRGLAFEIVAKRDIFPGEEVFIDYGIDWELAWAHHQQQWSPPSKAIPSWLSAKEANQDLGPIRPELVAGDLREEVNHPYLFTGCQYWETNADRHRVYRQELKWQLLSDEEMLERYADSCGDYCSGTRRTYAHHRDASHWPCTVLRYDPVEDSYVVRMHRAPWADDDDVPWHTNNVPRLLYNYTRGSIHYFVKPFASDQHLPGVFRHPMGIRDDMFPQQWKNLKPKLESDS